MKKIFLSIFIFFSFGSLIGQEYTHFNFDYTKWVMSETFPIIGPGDGHQYWEIHSTYDTLINSIKYKIIESRNLCKTKPNENGLPVYTFSEEYEYFKIGALREDSMKVMFYKFENPIGVYPFQHGIHNLKSNMEYPLYDFTKEVGDTIFYPPSEFYEVINNDSIFHSIPRFTVIQDIFIDNGIKTLKVNNSTSFIFKEINYIKEGRGSSAGLLAPYYSHLTKLNCYIPNYFIEQNCNVCNNIYSITYDNNKVETIIYPNPNNGRFTLSSDSHLGSVLIYNLNGELIKKYKSVNSNILELDLNIERGIYFLSILNKSEIQTKKIIIN